MTPPHAAGTAEIPVGWPAYLTNPLCPMNKGGTIASGAMVSRRRLPGAFPYRRVKMLLGPQRKQGFSKNPYLRCIVIAFLFAARALEVMLNEPPGCGGPRRLDPP
jgi:hypothetical protein